VLTSYGRSSGIAADPIEKKPLYHFLPGTSVLSFGTAGCNLGCRFCQNWNLSKAREIDTVRQRASPEQVAEMAEELGCRSVAFTYNDPVIFLEYAVDTARCAHDRGIRTVAVTSGYICREPREELFSHMDAANVDLKAFTDDFYRKFCLGHLQPVLETLEYLKAETKVWLELTTLLIPGENDSEVELRNLTQWVVERLGPDVPMHFSAFHPDWRMLDHPRTSPAKLYEARRIALESGVRYAYTGNLSDETTSSTYCHRCGEKLIGRDGFVTSDWRLDERGGCPRCGTMMAGVLDRTTESV